MDPFQFKMGWMLVAFDVPVASKSDRKHYTTFRKFLLSDGYQMIQYSVYARALVTYARMQTHLARLHKNTPPEGEIRSWYITKAQWKRHFIYHGPSTKAPPTKAKKDISEQMLLW